MVIGIGLRRNYKMKNEYLQKILILYRTIIYKGIMGLHRTSILSKYSLYPHYFLCNYLPASAGRDTLSRSLLLFKLGHQPDLDAWIDCTLESLAPLPWRPDTIIIRALQHDETTLPDPASSSNSSSSSHSPNSMDLLGQALAARLHCRYLPGLLRKSRSTRPCKELSRYQRITELRQAYTFTLPDPTPTPPSPILIIDDILTTGATLRTIIRAIRQQSPRSPLRTFTLAKADYDPTLNSSTPLRGQNYQLQQGTGWQVAEEETGYAKPTHPHPNPVSHHPDPQHPDPNPVSNHPNPDIPYLNRPDFYADRTSLPTPDYTLPAPDNFSNHEKTLPYSAEILRKWILANSF